MAKTMITVVAAGAVQPLPSRTGLRLNARPCLRGSFGDAIDGTAGYKVKPGFLVIAPDKDRHVPRRTRRELRRRRLCQHHAVAGGQFGRQVALRRALQSGSAKVCEGELRR